MTAEPTQPESLKSAIVHIHIECELSLTDTEDSYSGALLDIGSLGSSTISGGDYNARCSLTWRQHQTCVISLVLLTTTAK